MQAIKLAFEETIAKQNVEIQAREEKYACFSTTC